MKADPDFHPLASAWLHSDASVPQTRLLNEILAHGDPEMDEFAALCHTECLLRLHGSSRTDRLRALRALVSSKPSARGITPVLRRILWAAAALLLLAFGVRTFITPHQSEGDAVTRRKPAIMLPPANNNHRTTSPPSPSAYASRLETNLRHLYIASFKAQSSLPEAVALLAQSAQSQNRSLALKPEFKSNGDAPVHLALEYPFSAWALLQMMAIQTGTRVQLSGESVIFRPAEDAAPLEGIKSSGGSTVNLRRLVQPSGDHRRMGEYEMLEGLAAKQFGSPLNITRVMKYAMQFEGTPRLVRVLDYAMKLVEKSPVQVQLSFYLMRAAPGANGLPVQEGLSRPANGTPGLTGIFNPTQLQAILRVSGKQDWEVERAPSVGAIPNLPTASLNLFDGAPGGKWPRTKTSFTCFPNPDQPIDVHIRFETESGKPSSTSAETQVLVPDGHTIGLGGFEDPGGGQVGIFLTVQLVSPNPEPDPKNR